MMLRYYISICFLFAVIYFFAQEDVVLVGKVKREVDPATRIKEQPKMKDTVIPEPDIQYPLLSMQYTTQTEVDKIEPASIRIKDNLEQLYRSYAKVGVGTEFMPLGELYVNSLRSRKYNWGLHAKHLSSFGNIPDYERSTFDRTGIDLFGSINKRKWQLGGNIHYTNRGLHYYGVELPVDSIGKDSTAQRSNDYGIDVLFSTASKLDTMHIDYKIGAAYNHFNTKKPSIDSIADWRAKENYFALNGVGEYHLNSEVYIVGAELEHNKYTYGVPGDSISPVDSVLETGNTVFRLKPSINTFLWNNKFKATIGADITLSGSGKTSAHIYPNVEIKYSMFNNIFIPYVGLRGGMEQRSLKKLTLENEFIRPNVQLRNEDNAFEVYGGFKGTLSKKVGFNIGGGYARIRNKALFVNDTTYSRGNKFNVIYDTLNQLTLEGSITYQASEKLKVDVIGTYRSYELLNNTHAWNLPDVQLVTRVYYNLFEKVLFNLDFDLETGRRALVYGPDEGVQEENQQYFRELEAIYDFNFGIEYRYTKRLSAFVQLNNIASQRYKRWYNTPVHSFQFMGGLTFRF